MTVTHSIPTAVIGAGDWGKNHVRKYHELGALAAIAETNPETASRMQQEYGVKTLTFAEILSDPSIRAIALTSPANTHKDLGLKALLAGKHLFIEKPITLNHQDAAALTEKATEKGLILMVGHLLHYHPCFAKLTELVKAGELGDIHHIHARRFNIGKFREDENVLWDLGPHDVSMILAITGCDPISIEARSSNYLLPKVSDFASLYLTFPGNINAEINLSWLAPAKEHRFIVVGNKAMAVFDDTLDWDEKLRIYRHDAAMTSGQPAHLIRDMEGEAIKVPFKEPLLNECATFLDCIANNTEPHSNGQEATRVIKILEQADPALTPSITISKVS